MTVTCSALLLPLFVVSADDNLISLAELRRLVAERDAAVQTIEVRFRVLHKQFDTSALRHFPHDGLEDEVFTWHRSGNRQRVTREPWANAPGHPAVPIWASFDGRTGYQLSWWPDGKQVSLIVRSPEIPDLLVGSIPRFMPGERLPACRVTVLDLLRRPAARLAGIEEITGQRCQVVDLGTEMLRVGGLHQVTAWFDIEHGAMMRSFRIQASSDNAATSEKRHPRIRQSGTVGEIQSVHNPLTGRDEWWPKSLYSTLHARTTVVYDSIVLNMPIPDAVFVPDYPPGVEISDRRNGREVKSQIAGGDAGFAARMRAIDEFRPNKAEKLNPTPKVLATASVTGQPPTEATWPRWVLAGSVVSVLVAAWMMWRNRS